MGEALLDIVQRIFRTFKGSPESIHEPYNTAILCKMTLNIHVLPYISKLVSRVTAEIFP